MHHPTSLQNDPFVTILMPVRNEAGAIARSLGAVLAQDYPAGRVEIIIADGMSTDATRQVIRDFQRQRADMRLIDNPGKIVPTGLNAALRLAQGEIIVRVDGHCEIAPDYVSRCVSHILTGEVDGVGGSTETIGKTRTAQAIAIAMSSPFGVGDSAFRTESGKTMLADSVPFPAYTRAIIRRAGLYDEELARNQDDEYNYRLRKLGAKLLLAADVHSKYDSRSSLRSVWRQYYQYGYWKVRVLQKHPLQMRPRQFVPPLFVAGLLVSGLCGLAWPPARWLFLAILAAYLIANLGASTYTALRRGWKHLPLLPLVYAILHLSYGLGFLVGLLRFANRWGDRLGRVPPFDPRTPDGEHA
jgi:succinoglycan biosynthesis protein ExoA